MLSKPLSIQIVRRVKIDASKLLSIQIVRLHKIVESKSAGGRGKTGGLSEYADSIGKDKGNVSRYIDAAEVFKKCCNVTTVFDVLSKAAHLSAIHSLPESVWPDAGKPADFRNMHD